MRIKSLEIHGFKSFADRTKLHFGTGVTGVVGPNGCGKSNIIDALRWCMGEMSAKHLRGRAMQDVIFAGSDSRGSSGLAEVTLTLSNDGDVPPQYAAYSEISVTRRLHRDSSSEYLVNKVPARLKDITDLFLGTGVGTRAYSIIEQGRIGFIVSSRPEDRRTLIEEVAGITKFKARKKSAERRMQATEQNLARVNDIVGELERQLGSLKRQAKKAERYKKLKAELRDLDLQVAAMELLRIRAVEQVQKNERLKLEQNLGDSSRAVVADEARLEAERLRLVEEERRLQEEQSLSAGADAKLAALERDLAHWTEQGEENIARAQQVAEEVEQAKERMAQAETERRDFEATVRELSQNAEQEGIEADRASTGLGLLQHTLVEIDGKLEALRREALERVHETSRQRTLIAALDKQRVELGQRMERAQNEKAALEQRLAQSRARQEELRARVGELAQKRTQGQDRLRTLREQMTRSSAEKAEAEARARALRDELGERRSRLESLEEIARRFEGYSDGVRALMTSQDHSSGDQKSAEAAKHKVEGIRGLVTDILRTPPEYEKAIESALGEKLQFLIVESHRSGMEAIDFLKSKAAGRSGFIPLAPRPRSASGMPSAQPGLVGSAMECVSYDPEYRPIADYLLGDVVVVENLRAALGVWTANGHKKVLVTLDGEVLEPAGVLTGGADQGTGLLAKQREIRELQEAVAKLDRVLILADGRFQALQQDHARLVDAIEQLEGELHRVQLEQVEGEKDLQAGEQECLRLSERCEVLELELLQLREQLAGVEGDAQEALQAAGSAEAGQRDIEGQMHELQEERRLKSEEHDRKYQSLTGLRVRIASRDEKISSARNAIERLAQARKDYQERIERGLQAIHDANILVAELKERGGKGQVEAEQLATTAQELRVRLNQARARYEEERDQLSEIEQSLKEKRRSGELAQESMLQLKMDIQRLGMERDKIIEQMAERHEVDILKIMSDFHMRPVPTPQDQARRKELEKSIKNIGPINLTAIEECQEVETRCTFLCRQRDDLQTALDSLRRAIQRINRASRERFKEAFGAVNSMFQKLFPRLFRGGEARLELLAHDDILEAGVDIIAQPPGKKLQSVGLLSGGEKALTATALVFAIFLIKPSPFCVLDEVDAPLDDANVGRFNEMLREMAGISQFIVITHHKETMLQADRLYGITMEEPGMSKIVSVELEGQEEPKGPDEEAA